jgi:NADH-quinone oxidoreductase subunit G
VVYVLEDDPVAAGVFTAEQLKGVKVILHYYNTTNATHPAADVALPAAMVVETVGTYVNQGGRAQRVRPAKAIKGLNRTLMMEMGQSRPDAHGTPFDRWHNEGHYVNCKPSWVTLPEIAERVGTPLKYAKGPQGIMAELAAQSQAFAGATYDAMGLQGVQLQDVEAGETV